MNINTERINSIIYLIADALWKWLTNGSNAGLTGHVGVGPFKASGSAGFGAGSSGSTGPLAIDVPSEAVVGGKG